VDDRAAGGYRQLALRDGVSWTMSVIRAVAAICCEARRFLIRRASVRSAMTTGAGLSQRAIGTSIERGVLPCLAVS
jgi:hypothetical protein